MKLLRWIGGIVLFFWLLGLIFRIGGRMIHWLLVIAAIVFIYDLITGRKSEDRT
ncbi:lmo0937 family membrane protein [Clostridium sp. JNZ J1-5]|nr:lmo0937 family membrane protein [Clostridium sp.]